MKGKIKIISERVNAPFKEVEKEEESEEETEESLEEEISPETQEPENFTDFSREVVNPTLQSMPIPETTPNLEQELENVPSATPPTEEPAQYEANVYNMPDYTGYEETGIGRREMEERGVMRRAEDLRETRTRIEVEDWHEVQEARTSRERVETEDAVIGVREIEREGKYPWEYKEKRRKL